MPSDSVKAFNIGNKNDCADVRDSTAGRERGTRELWAAENRTLSADRRDYGRAHRRARRMVLEERPITITATHPEVGWTDGLADGWKSN